MTQIEVIKIEVIKIYIAISDTILDFLAHVNLYLHFIMMLLLIILENILNQLSHASLSFLFFLHLQLNYLLHLLTFNSEIFTALSQG